jgi:hypothetical protein
VTAMGAERLGQGGVAGREDRCVVDQGAEGGWDG